MIVLQKDHGKIGVGVTAPRLMEDSDGRLYVVKLAANRVGVKALANEWLGWRLGKRIGLPLLRAEMAQIAPRVLSSPMFREMCGDDAVHFATRYLANSEYVGRRTMMCAVNKDEVVGAMLFDHLLYNEDRTLNRKNLLARWERRGARIYVIDHSHLLGSGRWTAETLLARAEDIAVNRRLAYGWLIRHYVTRKHLTLYAERILSIRDQDVKEILQEIPISWLSQEDREAIEIFWQIRCKVVSEIAEKIASAADQYRRTERHIVK